MPHAAAGFFENGGKRVYASRVTGPGTQPASRDLGGGFTTTAVGPGQWGKNVWVRVSPGKTVGGDGTTGFRLHIAYWTTKPPQAFDAFRSPSRTPLPQYVEDY